MGTGKVGGGFKIVVSDVRNALGGMWEGGVSIKEMMTDTNHNHSMSNLCFMIDIL